MASIIIRGAKVERIIGNKGFSCSTAYKTRQGEEKKQYFTVWTDDLSDIQQSQTYDIRGLLSARLEEWDDRNTGEKRQRAAIHVNQPTITPPKTEDFSGYNEERAQAQQAQVKDIWPEVKNVTEEAPF